MIFADIKSFAQILSHNKRLMGIDLGERKIGIAFSDRNRIIATPYSVYLRRNMKKDMGFIHDLFKRRDSTAIVMGFPEGVGEKDNEWVEKVILFAKKLSKWYNVNVYLQDETLSTQEACDALKHLSDDKIERMNDQVAASCILQRVLDIIEI